MLIDLEPRTIKDIVVEDYRTAAIFEKYGLDFCCKGNRSLAQACNEKGISKEPLERELESIKQSGNASDTHLPLWSPSFLAEYIVQNHHSFVRAVTPSMKAHVIKVAAVHGENHPEMIRVRDLFIALSDELSQHMLKEEQILFPYIAALARARSLNMKAPAAAFGSVEHPINMMRSEHEAAGSALEEIRSLTKNFTPPADACTTYHVTLEELDAFEKDLHRHVHLENNILFPMALANEHSEVFA